MKPLDQKALAAFSFQAIGVVHSPFSQKFGVPRQPGLLAEARAQIQLVNDPDIIRSIRELKSFSHLWIVFVFHEHGGKKWKPTIRPPRLGGRKKVGSLSSRSPHRPNPIGISAVQIEEVMISEEFGPLIEVSGIDLIDQTPVLDIKPYLPFCDSIPEASSGWAAEEIPQYDVHWSQAALNEFEKLELEDREEARELVSRFLSQDPRPSFQKRKYPVETTEFQGGQYGFAILGLEVKYEIRDQAFWVKTVHKA